LSGAVISAVDLVRGIGVLAGLEVIHVPGATGFLDTNYLGKAQYGLASLRQKDFLFLHVEATDEAGHMGAADKKVEALENFDQKVVGTILEGLRDFPAWRVLLMPDHATPVAIKTHSSDPVPFAVLSSDDVKKGVYNPVHYNEPSAKRTGVVVPEAWSIMERFVRGESLLP
jgi:2,3-bisphosphoglycerate-independent phosphoglycerate mutase